MMFVGLSFIAFFIATLVLLPLPAHWRAQNVAIVGLIIWLFSVNTIYGVNAIIWAGNVRDSAPVWCDISTKIVVGASYALPLCTVCICKHLAQISCSRKASYDASDRRRRMIFDGVACFLVPMIFMALHYIVQGHRYDIVENMGCQAHIYISIPAIFIIWLPQLLFAMTTMILAAVALRNFVRQRLTFAMHLRNASTTLNTQRYLRLIAMSVVEMVWGTSLTAYTMWGNVSPGLRPWKSWADVHSNFSRVGLFPARFLPPFMHRTLLVLWWVIPASGLIFFVFFGFGDEAIKDYKRFGSWVLVNLFRVRPSKAGPSSGDEKKDAKRPISLRMIRTPVIPLSPPPTPSSRKTLSCGSDSTITLSAPSINKGLSGSSSPTSHYVREGFQYPGPIQLDRARSVAENSDACTETLTTYESSCYKLSPTIFTPGELDIDPSETSSLPFVHTPLPPPPRHHRSRNFSSSSRCTSPDKDGLSPKPSFLDLNPPSGSASERTLRVPIDIRIFPERDITEDVLSSPTFSDFSSSTPTPYSMTTFSARQNQLLPPLPPPSFASLSTTTITAINASLDEPPSPIQIIVKTETERCDD